MDLSERTYRVLLVSASQKMNDALMPLLAASHCSLAEVTADIASARRSLLENEYDIVIVNTPLPDEFGVKFAIDICEESNTGVMLLVKAEHFPELNAKTAPLGVLCISKPTSAPVISQSLTLICAMREKLRRMEQKAASIEDKMEEIRLTNKAKWLLVEQLKMTEPDAHRYIQKTAMDKGLSKRAVAESIIRMYS